MHQSQYNILVVANYFQKNVVLLDLLFDKILELMMSETTSMWTPEVEEYSTIKSLKFQGQSFLWRNEESTSTHYEMVYKIINVY